MILFMTKYLKLGTRTTSCILLFMIYSISSLAQLSMVDSIEADRLTYEMMQANQSKDFNTAILKVDSLINLYEQNNAWYDAYGFGLVWKLIIAAMNDRVELVYECIKLQQRKILEHSDDLGDQLELLKLDNKLRLGSYYVQRGNMFRAQKVFEEILNEDIKDKENYAELPSLLIHLSKVHKYQGNYIQALSYISDCKKSYSKFKALYPPGYESLIHKHTADIQALIGDNKLAEENYIKAIKLSDAVKKPTRMFLNGVINNYNAYAQFCLKIGNKVKAIELLEKSLSLQKNTTVSKTQETYRFLANAYIENNEFDKAEIFLKEAIQTNSYDTKNYPLALTYTTIANVYVKQGKLELALEYFQKALNNLQDDFDATAFCKNPMDFNQILTKKEAIKVFHGKAMALYKLSKERPEYLSCAWETIQLTIDLLDKVRTNNMSDVDKQNMLQENYQVFEDAIKISLAQPNDIGNDYAFEVAEKSKASLLLTAVRNTQIRDFFVPDSLIDLEEQYKFELLSLQENESKNTSPTSEFLSKQIKLDELINNFKKNYPEYFELRYSTEVITAENIKEKLEGNKVLIEYFVGQNQTYAFIIQKNKSTKVLTINLDEEDLNKLTQELLYSIYLPQITSTNEDQQKLKTIYTKSYSDSIYALNAFRLYEHLIKPIELVNKNSLEIIPDGVLNYLPFDALIKQRVNPKMLSLYENEMDYKYLARDHQISYCYSATLMDLMNNNKSQSKKDLLVFHSKDFSTQAETIKGVFNQYNLLQPFVDVVNEMADKDQLKTYSQEYKYLHFSVHGVIDNEQPSKSYLQLRPTADGDSLLYLKDIYSSSFPADMVITSACNAGVGPLAKGEGLLSLARGFAYSGTKSLITTLWEIKGGASNQLLKEFYKQIKEGATKDSALFLAKKANLNSAAYAHPYYWAGFIPIGNMEAIQMPFLSRNKLIFTFVFLMGGLVLFLLKKR